MNEKPKKNVNNPIKGLNNYGTPKLDGSGQGKRNNVKRNPEC